MTMPTYPMHVSKYFDVREWVSPRTWEELKQSPARCEWMIDKSASKCADLIRELSGVQCIINNWHFYRPGPGKHKYVSSGFRAKWDTTGAAYSQHRRGCAFDIKPEGWNPKRSLELIMDNKALFVEAGLTCIEDISYTPTWLHCDCRPRLAGMADITIIHP